MKKLYTRARQALNRTKFRLYYRIYEIFKDFTMTPANRYVRNLTLVNHFRNIKGCIVECGTWRGGMIGGMAKLLGNERQYFLFDSYEGLPVPGLEDGSKALEWQNDKNSPGYFDNCSAEMSYAERAMKLSGVHDYKITKGWFSETLPSFDKKIKIAILRLDGDWYDSTMQCFEYLYDRVVPGGIIIIDDYYYWEGCTRAVHDFLSKNKLLDKICNGKMMFVISLNQKRKLKAINYSETSSPSVQQIHYKIVQSIFSVLNFLCLNDILILIFLRIYSLREYMNKDEIFINQERIQIKIFYQAKLIKNVTPLIYL